MIIKNGVGDGSLARVYTNHHLATKSIEEPIIGYKSRVEQSSFSMSCPLAYTVSGTECNLMTIYNGETESAFVVNSLYIGHNGGDVTGNKIVYGRLYKGATVPTTGILTGAAIGFGNLNFGSSKITSVVAYLWDTTTGTGLSGGSSGTVGLLQMFSVGLTHVDLKGSLVLSPGQAIRVSMQGVEATKVTVSISGFLSKVAEE